MRADLIDCFNPYRVFKFVATLRLPQPPQVPPPRFNPYRVFKFVATSILISYEKVILRFQSLSGFQVRCNLDTGLMICATKEVSIPIGFSSSLQQIDRMTNESVEAGFNPYRVFKFVATLPLQRMPVSHQQGFNPYRVFKFVATEAFSAIAMSALCCFNPYRVFKFVATGQPIVTRLR